jgi:hypothetical protein
LLRALSRTARSGLKKLLEPNAHFLSKVSVRKSPLQSGPKTAFQDRRRGWKAIAKPVGLRTMNVFKIENQFCTKMEVQLEPWAETFYLRKGDIITFEQAPVEEGHYQMAVHHNWVQVFPIGFLNYPTVYINDQPAEPWNDFIIYPVEPL